MELNKLKFPFFLLFAFTTLTSSSVLRNSDLNVTISFQGQVKSVSIPAQSDTSEQNNSDQANLLVRELKSEFKEFEEETRQKFDLLTSKNVNVTTMIQDHEVRVTKLEGILKNIPHDNNTPSFSQRTAAPISNISFALLYDNIGDQTPLYTFNTQRKENPPCLNFRNTNVDEIDTNGTCVLLYKMSRCRGGGVKFETNGRQNVGPQLDDDNLSIGPCGNTNNSTPKLASLTDKSIPRAILYGANSSSPPPYYHYNPNEIESPACLTFGTGVKFIDTYESCVKLFSGRGCTENWLKVETTDEISMPKPSTGEYVSVGPCYALVDMYSKRKEEGSRQKYDSRKNGNCVEVNGGVKSVNTHDTCVQIYSQSNCQGLTATVRPGSPDHFQIDTQLSTIMSVGVCGAVQADATTTEAATTTTPTPSQRHDPFIPKALLYDEISNANILATFNGQNEARPTCLNFRSTDADAIDTFGSCVMVYTLKNCRGQSQKFTTMGKMGMGFFMDDNNWSVGPCDLEASTSTSTTTMTTPSTTIPTAESGANFNEDTTGMYTIEDDFISNTTDADPFPLVLGQTKSTMIQY